MLVTLPTSQALRGELKTVATSNNLSMFVTSLTSHPFISSPGTLPQVVTSQAESVNSLFPVTRPKVTPAAIFTCHVEGAHFAAASFALPPTPSPSVVVSTALHHRSIAAIRAALVVMGETEVVHVGGVDGGDTTGAEGGGVGVGGGEGEGDGGGDG
jgi:hypothetical protein